MLASMLAFVLHAKYLNWQIPQCREYRLTIYNPIPSGLFQADVPACDLVHQPGGGGHRTRHQPDRGHTVQCSSPYPEKGGGRVDRRFEFCSSPDPLLTRASEWYRYLRIHVTIGS